MSMKNLYLRLVLLILVTSCFARLARGQGTVIVNGGFDLPEGASYSIAPWVGTGTLLYTAGGCQNADGPNSMGIISGLLYQDVATAPGQSYLLTFYVAGWAPNGPLPVIHNLAVDWGTQRVGVTSFDSTGRTFQNMGWVQETFQVQSSGALTRLAFSNPNSISNPNVPLLDAVQLVPIPEPASWVLLGLAGATVVARKWRLR